MQNYGQQPPGYQRPGSTASFAGHSGAAPPPYGGKAPQTYLETENGTRGLIIDMLRIHLRSSPSTESVGTASSDSAAATMGSEPAGTAAAGRMEHATTAAECWGIQPWGLWSDAGCIYAGTGSMMLCVHCLVADANG